MGTTAIIRFVDRVMGAWYDEYDDDMQYRTEVRSAFSELLDADAWYYDDWWGTKKRPSIARRHFLINYAMMRYWTGIDVGDGAEVVVDDMLRFLEAKGIIEPHLLRLDCSRYFWRRPAA